MAAPNVMHAVQYHGYGGGASALKMMKCDQEYQPCMQKEIKELKGLQTYLEAKGRKLPQQA